MQQECYWCNNKSSSTKFIYGKWNHIRTIMVSFSIYYIRNSSLYAPIRKVLLEFLQLELFHILTDLIVTILFNFKVMLNFFYLLSDCNWTRSQNHLVCKRTLNHLANWLSFHLRTKWFQVRVQLQSLKLQILHLLRARSSLTFKQLQSVHSH